jgi:hypothetical protein
MLFACSSVRCRNAPTATSRKTESDTALPTEASAQPEDRDEQHRQGRGDKQTAMAAKR